MRTLTKALLLATAVGTFPAKADDTNKLKGTYASVVNVSCLQSSGGFDSKFEAIGAVISISSFTLEAVRTFNGDGTGSITQQTNLGYSYPINGPFFFPSASSGKITNPTPFTYTMTGDMVTLQVATTNGVVLTGNRAGQTSVTTPPPPTIGFITKDDKIVVSSPVTPVVQTITFSDGTVVPRICHSAGIETKID